MSHDDQSTDAAEAVKIWKAIKKQPIAMMVTQHETGLVSRPMQAHAAADEGALYFVTQLESGKTDDIGTAAPVNLSFADPANHTFISVAGQATISQDHAKLRELWDMWAEAWLPEGPDAPNVALITVEPGETTIWDSDSSRIVRTIKHAAAAITQRPPDIGTVNKVDHL